MNAVGLTNSTDSGLKCDINMNGNEAIILSMHQDGNAAGECNKSCIRAIHFSKVGMGNTYATAAWAKSTACDWSIS